MRSGWRRAPQPQQMAEIVDGRLIVAGARCDGAGREELRDPYRTEIIGEFHTASSEIVEDAVQRGRQGAREVASMPAFARADILRRAAEIVRERAELIA